VLFASGNSSWLPATTHSAIRLKHMIALYRYMEFRPPYQKPAGDVLAGKTVEALNHFARQAGAGPMLR